MTGLHWACKRNHLGTVKVLLEHGSRVNFQDELGNTPLNYAIENQNQKIVVVLLANKATHYQKSKINGEDPSPKNLSI